MAICQQVMAQDSAYFTKSFQKQVEYITPYKRVYQRTAYDAYTVKDYIGRLPYMKGTFKGFDNTEDLDKFIWVYKNVPVADDEIIKGKEA
jgi:hypothetical protein